MREADIWVMDSQVQYVDEIEPLPDNAAHPRPRRATASQWAVPFFKGLGVVRAPEGLLQQVILLGVDDATLAGQPPEMLLGSLGGPEAAGRDDHRSRGLGVHLAGRAATSSAG